jgi:hypothetical protein
MRAVLLIALRDKDRTVAITRIKNPQVLADAAKIAINERQLEAEVASEGDPGLAILAAAEARKVRDVLGALIQF